MISIHPAYGASNPSLRALIDLRSSILITITAVLLFGCRKDEVFTSDPGAKLTLTEDTILFDTIFTTIGSVTKRFTVRNDNSQAVHVKVTLEGGTTSRFRINVDGSAGTTFNNVEILGHDSIYIFVEITPNDNNPTNPFIFEDHILLTTNGNEQKVLLVAWGQDAHFFHPDHAGGGFPNYSIIPCGAHWINDKPYVIYGYAVVDSLCTLIIDAGVKVYFHGGAGLWIYRSGRIEALGAHDNRITFQSDRLEATYSDLPGQWDRIWINEGPDTANRFEYVNIKNARIGIQCETAPWHPELTTDGRKLTLNNVSIRNCSTAGIYSRNYRINSTNLLVADCGQFCAALTGGGQYDFIHSTFANYWSFGVRQDPAFEITNSFTDIYGASHVGQIDPSSFVNGIIYGNNTNEFKMDLDNSVPPTFIFRNFLFRTDQATNDNGHFPDQSSIYRNQDPGFADPSTGDYHIHIGAFAQDKGVVSNFIALTDLDFVDRVFPPDLGCYEAH